MAQNPSLPVPQGFGPSITAGTFLQSANVPPNMDPTEAQHMRVLAETLAAHVNAGQLAYADASKAFSRAMDSIRTTPPTSDTFPVPPQGTPTPTYALPGTGAPIRTTGIQPAPSTQHTTGTAPTGRSFADIQASGKYQSSAEREWYLNQLGRTVGKSGLPVPRPNLPPPGTLPTGMFSDSAGQPSIAPPSTGSGGLLNTLPDGSAMVPDLVHGTTARLSSAQVSAIRTIFPPSEWTMAMEVAASESGGDNNATGSAGERGIFQIHPVNWQNLGVDSSSLGDPFRNTEAAYKLWQESGWQPWTTAPLIQSATGRQGTGSMPSFGNTPMQPLPAYTGPPQTDFGAGAAPQPQPLPAPAPDIQPLAQPTPFTPSGILNAIGAR